MNDKELISIARSAMKNSYSPYSHFTVGAALLCNDGKVYTSCNIENATYGATNCAERTAFFKAVSEGNRDFSAIAICGGHEGNDSDFCPPCGICRQVMAEFCDPSFIIILSADHGNKIKKYSLGDLLPVSFSLETEK